MSVLLPLNVRQQYIFRIHRSAPGEPESETPNRGLSLYHFIIYSNLSRGVLPPRFAFLNDHKYRPSPSAPPTSLYVLFQLSVARS